MNAVVNQYQRPDVPDKLTQLFSSSTHHVGVYNGVSAHDFKVVDS